MARFKIIKLDDIGRAVARAVQVDSGVRAQIEKEAGAKAVKVVLPVIQPIAQSHHINLIQEMGAKLNGVGMPLNTAVGGQKLISVGLENGSLGVITTDHWAPLTRKYQERNPKSLTFWRKEGRLSGAYQAMARSVGRRKVRVQELKAKRNHHKGRVNVSFALTFPTLRFPFERGVSRPFINGHAKVDMYDPASTIDRKGLGRARFAEQNDAHPDRARPFMRRLSAFLGQQMYKDITAKLRNL